MSGVSVDRRAVPGTGGTVSRAGTTVPGEGEVPFSAESRHLARQFLCVPQEFGIVRRLANDRERGWGSSFGGVVCTLGSGVQLEIWMAGKSGLYFYG
jgi:hypothetical protein